MAYFCYGRKGFCEEDWTICGDCKFYNGAGGININDVSELVVMVRQEVAREIFEEIEFDIHQLMFERDEHRAIAIEGVIAELKKKYTGDSDES